MSDEPIVDRLEGTDVVTVTVREVSPSTFETEFGVPCEPDYDSFGGRHAVLATDVSVEGEVDNNSDEPVTGEQGEDIADESSDGLGDESVGGLDE